MRNFYHKILAAGFFAAFVLAGTGPIAAQEPAGESESEVTRNVWIEVHPTDDWMRHFRVGAMAGFNIKADFSSQGNLGVRHPAGVYDDGYVHPPPAEQGDDYTPNWGYNSASQISGNSLLMHNTTSYSAGAGTSEKEESPFLGLDVAYGGNLWTWGHARIGWEFGFGWLPVTIHDNLNLRNVNVTQDVFSFNTGGIAMPPPGYQGSATGPGWNIHSTPTPLGSVSTNGNVSGTRTLDVTLYTFRLGPSVYWDLSRDFGVSAGIGPAVGIVSGDLQFNETIETGGPSFHNRGKVGGTDVVLGGYVNAAVTYHIVDNGDLFLSAEYMPMEDATIGGGGRQVRLKLGGQAYLAAGINWPF